VSDNASARKSDLSCSTSRPPLLHIPDQPRPGRPAALPGTNPATRPRTGRRFSRAGRSLAACRPTKNGIGMSRRVLTIVLAEATLDLLIPWAEAGKLPVFSSLMARGAWGRLRSQMPMVTPQMAGTLVTGRSPGHHGLMDFWQRGADGQFRETQGSALRTRPIWQI